MTTQTKKTSNKTSKTAADTVNSTTADAEHVAADAIETVREQVKQTTADAKAKTDEAHESAAKLNNDLSETTSRFISGYMGILGGIADATQANTARAMTAAEKMVSARSVSEVAEIQAEFLRDSTAANYDRAQAAFETGRDLVADSASAMRESASEMWRLGGKAA